MSVFASMNIFCSKSKTMCAPTCLFLIIIKFTTEHFWYISIMAHCLTIGLTKIYCLSFFFKKSGQSSCTGYHTAVVVRGAAAASLTLDSALSHLDLYKGGGELQPCPEHAFLSLPFIVKDCATTTTAPCAPCRQIHIDIKTDYIVCSSTWLDSRGT